MSDGAMSREAMLASLPNVRLPVVSSGEMVADFAAAVAVGAVLALLVVALLRAAGSRRVVERAPTVATRRAASLGLPEDTRRVALLHLLREAAPERHAALQARLYRPGSVGLEEIEREVAEVA